MTCKSCPNPLHKSSLRLGLFECAQCRRRERNKQTARERSQEEAFWGEVFKGISLGSNPCA